MPKQQHTNATQKSLKFITQECETKISKFKLYRNHGKLSLRLTSQKEKQQKSTQATKKQEKKHFENINFLENKLSLKRL